MELLTLIAESNFNFGPDQNSAILSHLGVSPLSNFALKLQEDWCMMKRLLNSERVAADKFTDRSNKIRPQNRKKRDTLYGTGIDQLDSDNSD